VADEWRDQRREAADAQAARAQRARADDVARARELVTAFVAEAVRRNLRTTSLRARAGDTARTYRTGLAGWYLRRDGSLAIADDGELYSLTVPRSLRSRLVGVRPVPTDPRLQAGIGARDGESVALATLLDLRLAAGDSWTLTARGA
jgi:hypothetical protein